MKNIDFENLTDDQLDRLVNDFKTINNNIMQSKEENLEMKLKARDLEITALKDALFIRNQMIQRLDTTIADLNTELNDRENQLEERNVSIQAIEDYKDLEAENDKLGSQVDDLQSDLHLTEAQLRSKKIDVELLKDRVSILEKENQTLTEIADSATARLNDSSDFNIKLHVKNRDLRNEIERECKNFGEFIGHNFSTTNYAERWECDNTHELYDIEELYAKYVQHTQAVRV